MHHPIGYKYEHHENVNGNPVNENGNLINSSYFYNEEEIQTGKEKVKNKMSKGKKGSKKAGKKGNEENN
jgi:hypothetical protein